MFIVWFILPSTLVYAAGQPTIASSDVTPSTTSAMLSGSVNPNGSSTNAWYEFANNGSLQLQNIGSGTSDFDLLPYNLTGLTPNTTYKFRIVASNINGIVNGGWITFTTDVDPQGNLPDIISEDVTPSTTSAMLSGSVNPNGSSTNAWYETPNSGSLQLQNIGSGTSDFDLLPYNLTGLTPNTTYKFRIVASNINGIVNGGWMTYTTDATGGNSCNNLPTITSISPDDVDEDENSATVTITGTNFSSNSDALFEGSNRTTTFISSTSLEIDLTSADLDQDGNFDISVTNGTNCTSNSETFTVNNQSSGGGGGGGGGSSSSSDPDVVTITASNVDEDSATFNATIDPNNRNTTAWFQYGTDSDLSDYNETTHQSEGSGNGAEDFSQSVSGLDSNTQYYFRAVANNSGGTTRGSIKSFTTSEEENTNNSGVITTVQSTNRTSTSAKLNAVFLNQDNEEAEGYFEYGTNLSLSSETRNNDLGNNTYVTFSDTITNLIPNTIYYFRAVVVKNGETYRGRTLVFQTSASGVITTVTTTTQKPTVITEESNILTITNDANNYEVGDAVEYLVTFENITSKKFENTIVSVQLPDGIKFSSSNYGKLSGDTVSFDAGTLVAGQIGSMTIFGDVVSRTSENVIVTTAIMTYENEDSNLENTEIAYVTNKILGEENDNSLTGNALFGFGTFLPATLLGWLLLIVIILAILLLTRRYLLPARYQTAPEHDTHGPAHH